MEFKQGIPKEIEAAITEAYSRYVENIYNQEGFFDVMRSVLAPAIAELESSATAKALAAAAELAEQTCDSDYYDNPGYRCKVAILALTPPEVKLREGIRTLEDHLNVFLHVKRHHAPCRDIALLTSTIIEHQAALSTLQAELAGTDRP